MAKARGRGLEGVFVCVEVIGVVTSVVCIFGVEGIAMQTNKSGAMNL